MRKARTFFLLAVFFWLFNQAVFVFSQEEDEDSYPDYDEGTTEEDKDSYPDYNEGTTIDDLWDEYSTDIYAKGDQAFTITLGVIFPTLFYNNGKRVIEHNFTPPIGGTGSLSYNYFLNSFLFAGAEIGVKFNYTLAKNTIFIIPFGLRAGVQFVHRRMEFPIVLVIGAAPQRYLNFNYTGLFIKGGASVFFRFNPDWSFGLNTEWSWYPQRPNKNKKEPDPARNMDGNFLGVTLTARYHF